MNNHPILDVYLLVFQIHYRIFGNLDRVLFVDVDAIIYVLKDKEILTKNFFIYKILSFFIGKGTITAYGKEHEKQRKLMQPAFHFHVSIFRIS